MTIIINIKNIMKTLFFYFSFFFFFSCFTTFNYVYPFNIKLIFGVLTLD